MLLTVIIPVFNASNYLSECLESILNQSFDGFEVLCVDDGSTDHSLELLKQYERDNSRVKVYHQTNQGVSAARNVGLKYAKGQYVTFVDADDTISSSYFDFLNKIDLSEDVVFGKDFLSKELSIFSNTVFSSDEIKSIVLPEFLKSDQNNSVCNKYYKTSIIREFSIDFPLGRALGEDGEFNFRFLLKAKSLRLITNQGYVYRDNPTSATRNISKHNYLEKFINDENRYSIYYDQLPFEQYELERWASIKMIKNILGVLSLYFRSSTQVPLSRRKAMVKQMIANTSVKRAVHLYGNDVQQSLSRFENTIFNAIKKESYYSMYCAYVYSHWRNGIK